MFEESDTHLKQIQEQTIKQVIWKVNTLNLALLQEFWH